MASIRMPFAGNSAREPSGYPDESVDALSGILDTIHLRSLVWGSSQLSAPWGIRFPQGPTDFPPQFLPPRDCIPLPPRDRWPCPTGAFHVITGGNCVLDAACLATPVPLAAGDLVILLRGPAHILRDSLSSPILPVWEIHPPERSRQRKGIIAGGGGTVTSMIHGVFFIGDPHDNRLLSDLPPLLHLQAGEGGGAAWLEDTVDMLNRETSRFEPGAQSVINHLTQTLFIRAVRAHLASLPAGGATWLRAIQDPEIGTAIGLIHDAPNAPWTVQSLADTVAISRSAFAARFTALLGQAPLQYLTGCRMRKAAEMLGSGQAPIKKVAIRVGYDSEAAFSKAFKRTMGIAPSLYRKDAPSDMGLMARTAIAATSERPARRR